MMARMIAKLVACHLIGDYCLQGDFIARTKGENSYHLFIHCFLYVIPFWVAFGWGRSLGVLFFSHAIVDALKARYHKISYWLDQAIHYAVLAAYLLWRWVYGST